jgi:hypothetical protein
MGHDPVEALLDALTEESFPQFTLVAVDQADQPVAKAYSLPFSYPNDAEDQLSPGGYDAVVVSAANGHLTRRPGNLLATVEITVRSQAQGTGLAAAMLDAARRSAAAHGFADLFIPARPTHAHQHPDVPLAEYATWTRDTDGLPADPWLRAQVRAGGRIIGMAPHSMVITGTLAEWRGWTGLPFDTNGPVRVPGALAPVHCHLANDVAVYVEPNVWIQHHLR